MSKITIGLGKGGGNPRCHKKVKYFFKIMLDKSDYYLYDIDRWGILLQGIMKMLHSQIIKLVVKDDIKAMARRIAIADICFDPGGLT